MTDGGDVCGVVTDIATIPYWYHTNSDYRSRRILGPNCRLDSGHKPAGTERRIFLARKSEIITNTDILFLFFWRSESSLWSLLMFAVVGTADGAD